MYGNAWASIPSYNQSFPWEYTPMVCLPDLVCIRFRENMLNQ